MLSSLSAAEVSCCQQGALGAGYEPRQREDNSPYVRVGGRGYSTGWWWPGAPQHKQNDTDDAKKKSLVNNQLLLKARPPLSDTRMQRERGGGVPLSSFVDLSIKHFPPAWARPFLSVHFYVTVLRAGSRRSCAARWRRGSSARVWCVGVSGSLALPTGPRRHLPAAVRAAGSPVRT